MVFSTVGDVKSSKTNAKLFKYFTGSFSDFWEHITNFAENSLVKRIIAPVNQSLLKFLSSKNIDVDKNFNHVMDNYSVFHTLNEHGNKKSEESRGQVQITELDIEKVDDVIQTFDYIGVDESGGIICAKKYKDGTIIYVEEVRRGRKELAFKTMRKMKGNIPSDLMKILVSSKDLNAQDDSAISPLLTNISPSDSNINHTSAKILKFFNISDCRGRNHRLAEQRGYRI